VREGTGHLKMAARGRIFDRKSKNQPWGRVARKVKGARFCPWVLGKSPD